MGEVTLDELVQVDQRYSGDDWKRFNKMESLCGDREVLSRLLWQAMREDRINLGGLRNAWYNLGYTPDAYDAADFLKLLGVIAAHCATQTGWEAQPWSDDELPGWPMNFGYPFKQKAEADETFAPWLAEHYKELPHPYDDALAYHLCWAGAIAWQDLPEWLLPDCARLHVRTTHGSGKLWSQYRPWPEDVWGPAIVAAALDPKVEVMKDSRVLEDLLPHIHTADELITILPKLGATTERRLPQFEAIAAHATDALRDGLLTALTTASDDLLSQTVNGWEQPYPAFYMVLSYLSVCQATETSPDPASDRATQLFIHHYNPGWSGSDFDVFQENIHKILGAVPLERLTPMFTSAPKPPFLLAAACPTPEATASIVQAIAGAPKDVPYNFEEHAQMALRQLEGALVPALSEALLGDAGPHRGMLVSALAQHATVDAIPALVHCLADTAKGVRESARTGLTRLGGPELLEALEAPLHARKKQTRLEAATVLAGLPVTARRYELAQARLDKEKTGDVREMLERVSPPAEDGGALPGEVDPELRDAIAQALSNQNAERWTEFQDAGPSLVDGFMIVWAEASGSSTADFYDWENTRYTRWLQALTHLGPDDAHAFDQAVTLAGAASSSSLDHYFGFLDELYGAERVAEELADRLERQAFSRPALFERCTWNHPHANGMKVLLKRYPTRAIHTAIVMLADKRKTARAKAVDFLTGRGDEVPTEPLVALLSSKKKDARDRAAFVLGELGRADALPALQAQHDKEKTAGVQRTLGEAIVKLTQAAFDPDTFAEDAVLDAALGELPRVPVESAVAGIDATMTRPRWRTTGDTMSHDATRWFVSELTRESVGHEGEDVRKVAARLEREDLEALGDELYATSSVNDMGWRLMSQAIVASDAQLEQTGRRLETYASSQSYNWSTDAVEMFARRGTPHAVRILDDFHRKTRRDAGRWRSLSGLREMAERQGVPLEELLEAAVDTFGFDERGEQRFDYGARTIVVKLEPGDQFAIFEEGTDKIVKSMPSARKADDAALVKTAKAAVSQLKKEVKRVRKNQTRRLELAMVDGRRWVPSVWRERYPFHPLMRTFAQGMVWGAYDLETNELLEAFHVDESGDAVTLEDDTYALDDAAHRVGVVHPAELSGEARTAWLEHFVDYELLQSFEQLERPVYAKTDVDEDLQRWLLTLAQVPAATFAGRAERLGFERGGRGDGGSITQTYRSMGPWSIELQHTWYNPEMFAYDDHELELEGVKVTKDGETKTMHALPDHLFSELVHQLNQILKR